MTVYTTNNATNKNCKTGTHATTDEEAAREYARIAELLAPDGVLAQNMRNYEQRPEQLQMAFAVAQAFSQGQIATIEAGTGTGKSLAYLIPAVLWAIENGETVVISTNTINLQEQLICKDIPVLKQIIPESFSAVLVKGRSNYLCKRRLNQALLEPDLFNNEAHNHLYRLQQWAASSNNGSKDELDSPPEPLVWNEVCCEIDQCPLTHCQHYRECFFHQARHRAAQADILVANHALLMADLAIRAETENYSTGAVLPAYAHIIFDEAHHIEDAATNSFSINISRFSLNRILSRLAHPRKPERGQIARWARVLGKELPAEEELLYEQLHGLLEEGISHCNKLHQLNADIFDSLLANMESQTEKSAPHSMPWRITTAECNSNTWITLEHELPALSREALKIRSILDRIFALEEHLPDSTREKLTPASVDLAGLSARLTTFAGELDTFLSLNENLCTWIDIRPAGAQRRSPVLWLQAAPIVVADILHKHLHERFKSVIMTSATLTVNQSFGYFHQRSGVGLCPRTRTLELQLNSPFDFSTQALIAVPSDLPAPGSPAYADAIAPVIEHSVTAAGGNTFVLFTAYSLMRQLFNTLEPVLFARGITCLSQGQAARHHLLKHYISATNQVLFGTDSFWEGVDVPGKALELVIITRLPFKVPTEPIQVARSEALKRSGLDPFMHFTVPQAVIKLKQGFGRLIRHRNDRGVVMILDHRVVRKGYGKMFLNSLPPARMVTAPEPEVRKAIREFFA